MNNTLHIEIECGTCGGQLECQTKNHGQMVQVMANLCKVCMEKAINQAIKDATETLA